MANRRIRHGFMMSFELYGVRVTISYPFLAVVTLFLSLDRTGLGGCMLCGALLHELGHITLMVLFGQTPRSVAFCSFGIRMEKQQNVCISYGKEIAIYMAGPLVNLLAALLFCWAGGWQLTQLAQVHLVLGLFNLLPIGVLDGGMIVANLLQRLAGPRVGRRISRLVSLLLVIPAVLLTLLLAAYGYGNITMIITVLYLAFGVFFGKHAL